MHGGAVGVAVAQEGEQKTMGMPVGKVAAQRSARRREVPADNKGAKMAHRYVRTGVQGVQQDFEGNLQCEENFNDGVDKVERRKHETCSHWP